jgi:hypothetical protein
VSFNKKDEIIFDKIFDKMIASHPFDKGPPEVPLNSVRRSYFRNRNSRSKYTPHVGKKQLAKQSV